MFDSLHRRRSGPRSAAQLAIAVLVLTLGVMGLAAAPAQANGAEALGPPNIAIATGTDVVMAGVGTASPGATLEVEIPAGVTIVQALLYWEGIHKTAVAPDRVIKLDGQRVRGKLIGSTLFTKGLKTSVFRQDITDMGLLAPGSNALPVTGMSFQRNGGVGVIVIYDDGGGTHRDFTLFDGADVGNLNQPGTRKTTVPKTFFVTPSSVDRNADLLLQVADIGEDRPHEVVVEVDGLDPVVHTDVMGAKSGEDYDALVLPVYVPAGASTITVQVSSADDGSGHQPASLVWISAGLLMDAPCTIAGSAPTASGRAYGVTATVSLPPLPEIVIPPVPDTDLVNPDTLLSVDLNPAVDVTAGVLNVLNETDIATATASDRAISLVKDLSVELPTELGGFTISADSVLATSFSVAGPTSASSSTNGSKVEGLEITDPTRPIPLSYPTITSPVAITIDPLAPLAPGAVKLEVTVLTPVRSGAADGVTQPVAGRFASGTLIEGIHIQVTSIATDAVLLDAIVASADSMADAPEGINCGDTGNVAGSAFLASVDDQLDLADTIYGPVVLPSSGGHEELVVGSVPTLGNSSGTSHTEGTTATPSVDSFAEIEDLDLFELGELTATAVRANSGSVFGYDSGDTIIADVVLGGTNLCSSLGFSSTCLPDRNTVLLLGDEMIVVLNEQLPSATGGLTVNAIHIYVIGASNPLGLPEGADVIIASASSDSVL